MTEDALECPFCAFNVPRGAWVCRGCGAEIRHGGDGGEAGAGCGGALICAVVAYFVMKVVASEFFGVAAGRIPTWVEWTVLGAGALAGLGLSVRSGRSGRSGRAERGDGRPRVRFVRRDLNGHREEREG